MDRVLKILLIILSLGFSSCSHATNWLTYYVYSETEYSQGPWIRTSLFQERQYRYLAAEVYEDLLGSEPSQFAEVLLTRLKERKPDLYHWNYDLSFQGDTVLITPKDIVKNEETIKNEITATLVFNGFKAVIFYNNGKPETLTIANLTVPYFDLVSNRSAKTLTPDTPGSKQALTNLSSNSRTHRSQIPFIAWLTISIILNIALAGIVIKSRRSHRS